MDAVTESLPVFSDARVAENQPGAHHTCFYVRFPNEAESLKLKQAVHSVHHDTYQVSESKFLLGSQVGVRTGAAEVQLGIPWLDQEYRSLVDILRKFLKASGTNNFRILAKLNRQVHKRDDDANCTDEFPDVSEILQVDGSSLRDAHACRPTECG